MMNRTLTVTSLLALGMIVGCAKKPTPTDGATGQLELAITAAPEDGTCIQIDVAGTRTVERDVDVKPGDSTVLTVGGLPLGPVTVTVNAFAGKCSALTSTSVPTWVGDPVTTTLFPGLIGKVTVTLVRNGRLSVAVDFNDPASFFDAKCVQCLKENCGDSLKQGCGSLKGAAEEGPGTGIARTQLCGEALACTVTTHCGRDDLSTCYCGGAPGNKCTDDNAGTGPCKLTYERAFEAVQPLDVPVRFTDTTFAGGVALNLLQCASDSCAGCL